MSSSIIASNAARFPAQIAVGFVKSPCLLNDMGDSEVEEVARILLRAGQRVSLESLLESDGVLSSVKGSISRVLAAHKRSMH